jgi:hypothetical protein
VVPGLGEQLREIADVTRPARQPAWCASQCTHLGSYSAFYVAQPPAPAGSHVELGLARSTHATYAGNPNSVPVVHPYFIEYTFVVLLDLYYFGQISFEEYAFYLYLADVALNECLVEDFTDQGGMFAPTRTDVGEPAQPLNGAGFIQDTNTGIRAILDAPLWTVS